MASLKILYIFLYAAYIIYTLYKIFLSHVQVTEQHKRLTSSLASMPTLL